MAEFCLECWNKMHHKKCDKWDVKLSWGIDFCEGCGKWKRVVLEERKYRDDRFVFGAGNSFYCRWHSTTFFATDSLLSSEKKTALQIGAP